MIPQRFSHKEVKIPLELQLVFDHYDREYDPTGEIDNYWLIMQLRGYLQLRPNASSELKKLVEDRLQKVRIATEATLACKAETGMAVALPQKVTF